MPICVAGMHRSGTSLVARMLSECGVAFGPEHELYPATKDNADGYYENVRFVELNKALLGALDGAWDAPPELEEGWELRPEIVALRPPALELIRLVGAREPWAWKDPRNALTLPFWQRLLPNLKVVVCVRNPCEVSHSLAQRGSSSERFGLGLWTAYNRSLLDAVPPKHRIVTHYDAYFHNPRAEIQRVCSFFELSPSADAVERAAQIPNERIRHHVVPHRDVAERVPAPTLEAYEELCAEAGPAYAEVVKHELEPRVGARANPLDSVLVKASSRKSSAPPAAGHELARDAERESQESDHLDALRRRIDVLTERQEEQRRLLHDSHEQLLLRDEDIDKLAEENRARRTEIKKLRAELKAKNELVESLGRTQKELETEIRSMESTRIWRLGQQYWRWRELLKRPLRLFRGRP